MDSYVWLALIVLGIIIEVSTTNLVAVWFVIGFLFALIVSFFCDILWLEILVAVVVSIVALILTRPFVKKISKKTVERTNADRYIGKIAAVTEDILDDSGKGRVEVSGSSWAAISKDGSIIEKGSSVIVESISGVKLVVTRIE